MDFLTSCKLFSELSNDLAYFFSNLGIHAREWISPATATFIIHELVVNTNFNSDVLDFYDFYILPVANPDGYEITSVDTLWSLY